MQLPPIPGFEARLFFDTNPSLDLVEVYSNAINTMAWLAVSDYSGPLASPTRLCPQGYREELIFSPWPPQSESRLQVKHVVQAVHEAGFALAAKPITVPGSVPRLYAMMLLDGQQIGFMRWQHRSDPVAGGANGTVTLTDAANLTGVLQLAHRVEPTGLEDTSGVIVDPVDPRFEFSYSVLERDADLPNIFTAFLDVLATAATNDALDTCDVVNAVSFSGDFAVNVHETSVTSQLYWISVIQALRLLWERVIIQDRNFKEIDFKILYDGTVIGAGFTLSFAAARTSVPSSR